jgi:hypothetical protein
MQTVLFPGSLTTAIAVLFTAFLPALRRVGASSPEAPLAP